MRSFVRSGHILFIILSRRFNSLRLRLGIVVTECDYGHQNTYSSYRVLISEFEIGVVGGNDCFLAIDKGNTRDSPIITLM